MLLMFFHKYLQLMRQSTDGKMFIFRFTSYQILQYLLIFFVSSGVIAKQKPVKCAAYGEYCLNHWDCCSNACLSYMYRCARGHGVYPYPFLGVSYKPTVTLEQILDQNFGSSNALPDSHDHAKPYFTSRFSVDDDSAASEIKIVLTERDHTASDAPTSENPVNSIETTSTAVLQNDLISISENSHDLEDQTDSLISKNFTKLEETSTASESYLCEEKTEIQTVSGLETTQETVKKSSYKPSCAEIGEKCYYHEDCCHKLCHGYLHQCVT